MKKFKLISLLLMILFISLAFYPAFAHKKGECDCEKRRHPKPKPPPQDPKPKPPPQDPQPEPPPQDPQPEPPPKDPQPEPPPQDPQPQPPPEDPKPQPPPEDPKPKPPPEDPKPKPPPQDPEPKPPPQDPEPKPPPEEPKPKPPPQEPKPKPPPQEPKPKPPPQEPKPKPPPQDPKPKPPPQDPLPQPPPEDPQPQPPPEDPQPQPPPEDPQPQPPPEDPQPQTPPQEPEPQPPPEDPQPQTPPQDPEPNPPPEDPKPKPPPQDPMDEPIKPTPFHDKYKGRFSIVYAFGDSYTDTGNAQFMGSLSLSFSGSLSSPYGSTTFGKSSNRLCDGRLVLDFITDSLGLPTLPPYQSTSANFTNGANFAIAGATTLAKDLLSKFARLFLWKSTPLGIWTQLDWYKKFQIDHICKGLDQKACSEKLKTALFWVGEIGINDYSRAVGSTIPLRTIARSSVTYTTELVRTLIRNGAKNIVVQGLPPIGCLPLDISITPISIRDRSGCSPIVNAVVVIHNQLLQAKLEMYRKLYPDVTIIYADSWKAYYAIVNNPKSYKIREIQKTCCGSSVKQDGTNFNIQSLCGSSGTSVCDDPSQYISWDGIHPTESMNYHMTDQYINQGCCNPPFEQLMKN